MELSEKLQELRKEKGLTQEELAEALFVSRTAISKWESGRGVPNIESLKAISKFFSVSIDELLSGEEILKIADEDNKQKEKHTRDLVFGLLDCSLIMFLFLPFFGQKGDEIIKEVSLLSLTGTPHTAHIIKSLTVSHKTVLRVSSRLLPPERKPLSLPGKKQRKPHRNRLRRLNRLQKRR